jgi:hypothetical protein
VLAAREHQAGPGTSMVSTTCAVPEA